MSQQEPSLNETTRSFKQESRALRRRRRSRYSVHREAGEASVEARPISKIEHSGQTRRQELTELLSQREYSFEELRHELQAGVRELEDHLRHVERSLRREERRLITTPPRCSACSFAFRERAPKRFHTPSRCPLCKSERIFPARLHVR